MLQSRNLSAVLSQVIQRQATTNGEYPRTSIVSSILITVSGQPVASYHTNRVPPPPHTTRSSSALNDDDPSSQIATTFSRNKFQDPQNMNSSSSSITGTAAGSSEGSQPYQVSRSMKTKVYALFAFSAWQEYQRAGMGHVTAASDAKRVAGDVDQVQVDEESEQSYSNQHDWICFKTEDATHMLITPVNLESTSSQLLLILVADEECPLGLILKKAQETVKVLEEGLDKYRVYE